MGALVAAVAQREPAALDRPGGLSLPLALALALALVVARHRIAVAGAEAARDGAEEPGPRARTDAPSHAIIAAVDDEAWVWQGG